MRNTIAVIGVMGVCGLCGAAAQTGAGQGRGPAPAQAAVPDAPTGATAFWTSDDIQTRWRNNDAKRVSNSRLFNGPTNISATQRMVHPGDILYIPPGVPPTSPTPKDSGPS